MFLVDKTSLSLEMSLIVVCVTTILDGLCAGTTVIQLISGWTVTDALVTPLPQKQYI